MKKNQDLIHLGEAIRLERLRRHLSQEELAEAAQLSQSTHISRIEKADVDMRVSTLIKILRALNIKFDDLIDI